MKVYVIQKGYYSDRHIIGIVETKEEADNLVKILKDTNSYSADSVSYEEFDTKQFCSKLLRFEVEDRSWYPSDWSAEYDEYDLYKEYDHNTCDYENHYIIYASTPQQAIKIAQDMKAQMMAEKEGIV